MSLFRGYKSDNPIGLKKKRKHLHIYSSNGNWGKSHVVNECIGKKYRSQKLTDVNNATDLYDNVGLFIIDEYGATNKFDILTLKCITSGEADGRGLNRKSYGNSHKFPPMCQFITLSNQSMYKTYAGRDGLIDYYTAMQLRKRFKMVKLDGDDDLEFMKCVDPQTMEFRDRVERLRKLHIKDGVKRQIRFPNDAVSIINKFIQGLKEAEDDNDIERRLKMGQLCSILSECTELHGEFEGYSWVDICTVAMKLDMDRIRYGDEFLIRPIEYDACCKRSECISTLSKFLRDNVVGFDEKIVMANEFLEAHIAIQQNPKNTSESFKKYREILKSKKHLLCAAYHMRVRNGNNLVRDFIKDWKMK